MATYYDTIDDFTLGADNYVAVAIDDESSPPVFVGSLANTDVQIGYVKGDRSAVGLADPGALEWIVFAAQELYILLVPAAICNVEGPLYITVKPDSASLRTRRYKTVVKAATIADRVNAIDVATDVGTALTTYTAPTLADVKAVWDELESAHLVPGSLGLAVKIARAIVNNNMNVTPTGLWTLYDDDGHTILVQKQLSRNGKNTWYAPTNRA